MNLARLSLVVLVEVDTSLFFSGSATDREGDLPATFLWDFDQASGDVVYDVDPNGSPLDLRVPDAATVTRT